MGIYGLFNYYSSPFLTEDGDVIAREDGYQIIVEDPGTGTLWGQSDPTDTRLYWLFQVDWDGDGVLDTTNEAPLIVGCTIDRGRDYFLNTSSSGFEPVRPGKLTLKLENKDRRFDPYNTSSPLYPYITPGKMCQIATKVGIGGTKVIRFTGYIKDIRPISGSDYVQITAVDKLQKYKDRDITLTLRDDITVSDAIEAILDGISDSNYSIDSVLDTISYYWVDKKRVMTAITEIVDASLGIFFVDAEGYAKYYGRDKNDVALLTIDQSEMLREIQVNQPWDVIRNNIDVVVNSRNLLSTDDIWTLGDIPEIAPGSSITIWAEYTSANEQVPAINVISPAATTDYTMNTAADGTGTDLTASFTVTASIFSQSAKLVITNGSASTGYVTLLKIRGDAVAPANVTRLSYSDTASEVAYGSQYFTLDSPWLQNINIAQDILTNLEDFMADPRKYPIVQLQYRNDIQTEIDLFDRIDITIDSLGIEAPYRIGALREEWLSDNGQDILSTLTLEPIVNIISGDAWIFTTEIGITSRFS